MRKVKKDNNVPTSLTSDIAQTHRDNMALAGQYTEEADSTYRSVKKELMEVYHRKCAYCEFPLLEASAEVEHYRPKREYQSQKKDAPTNVIDKVYHKGYFWLSLSWDNLLVSCKGCNARKGSKFEILGERLVWNSSSIDTQNIHYLTEQLNKQEQPLLIHPEYNDPDKHLKFNIDGQVNKQASDELGKYTCDVCNLNREDLVSARRSIIEELKTKILDCICIYNNTGDKERLDQGIINIHKEFIQSAECAATQNNTLLFFSGFRRQMAQDDNWNKILKEVLDNND